MQSVILATFSCVVLQLTSGAPVSIAPVRLPCKERHKQVSDEIETTGSIRSEPSYVPECDLSGRYWMPAQCSNTDRGFCFCVDPESGIPKDGSISHYHPKEQLECVYTAPPNDTRLCQHRQNEYRNFRAKFGSAMGNVLEYNPECLENGSFKALQRDSLDFFCVDTMTGKKIPGTAKENLRHRPLINSVCRAYSLQWRAFMVWLRSAKRVTADHDEHKLPQNASSCEDGLEFVECGCARVCQPGVNMAERELETTCDNCKPVCSCPEGSYEFNGTCVSNEKCLAAEIPEESHEIVDIDSVWEEYQRDYPNQDVLNFRLQTGEYSERGQGVEYSNNLQVETPNEVESETELPTEVVEHGEEYYPDIPEEVQPPVSTPKDMYEDVYVDVEVVDPVISTSTSPTTTQTHTIDPSMYYTYEEEEEEETNENQGMNVSQQSAILLELLRNAVMQERTTMKLNQQLKEVQQQLETVNQQIDSVFEEEYFTTAPPLEEFSEIPEEVPEEEPSLQQALEAEFKALLLPVKKSAVNSSSS